MTVTVDVCRCPYRYHGNRCEKCAERFKGRITTAVLMVTMGNPAVSVCTN